MIRIVLRINSSAGRGPQRLVVRDAGVGQVHALQGLLPKED